MKRVLTVLLAVAFAASVAYLLVMPETFDELEIEMPQVLAPADQQPVKDASRVGGEPPPPAVVPAPAETGPAGEHPAVGVLDPDALPFPSGCGMWLSREGEYGAVFIDAGPEGGGTMAAAMVIDGVLVEFDRSQADGDPMEFGQYPRQVFVSSDQAVTVAVEATYGEQTSPGEVPVRSSTVTVMKSGRLTLQFPAAGRAGC